MANIYTIASPGTAFVQDKCMIGIYNGAGSGKVVRVYRIYQLNAQTAAITGTNNIMELWRFSSGSGGLAVQIVKHDSQSVSPPSQIIASTGMSYTNNDLFRRYFWSSDEPVATDVTTIDEIQVIPWFGCIYDYSTSYINSTIEPIVLREGYGIGLVHKGAYTSAGVITTPVGSCDVFIEFTIEGS
jgi:hypothetical protein